MRRLVAAALLGVLATPGCGYLFGDSGLFRDQSEDYKRAPETPRLTLPEGAEDAPLRDVYPVPPVQEELLVGEFEVPRPAPLVAGAADEVVRIQRLGDDSWALLTLAPGQVWPQVRSFLAAAGLTLSRADARAGFMETEFVELTDAKMASRFRFRIEQGVQRGTSELHVLQMNQAGDITSWPDRSDDMEQENDVLQALAQYLANSTEGGSVAMVAEQGISAEGKIALRETAAGESYIDLGLPFTRAWASLARSLERSGFEITDRNRSDGLYYVLFTGAAEDQEDGWFDWLFNDDDHPLTGTNFLVAVQTEGADRVAIKLGLADGEPMEKRERQNLLALIKGNIN